MIPTVALVASGGAAGAVARYLVGRRLSGRRATVVVNTVGSGALGLLLALAADVPSVVAVAGVGFCGAFTTFSTVAVELHRLAADGDRRGTVRFGAGVAVASLAAAALGTLVGRVLLRSVF